VDTAAALSFAIYNTTVKKKPGGTHPVNFLLQFSFGTIILFPFYLSELNKYGELRSTCKSFNNSLSRAWHICYLFLYLEQSHWALGSGRTALFGNLIPVFSSIEAVFFLGEKIIPIHIISFILVVSGLVIANLKK
jgi:drug/metabolite transporter (DMT)-like permease